MIGTPESHRIYLEASGTKKSVDFTARTIPHPPYNSVNIPRGPRDFKVGADAWFKNRWKNCDDGFIEALQDAFGAEDEATE